MNEATDDFLFHLKRRSGEGATAFTSRFRAAASRLENLIAADGAAGKREPKQRWIRHTAVKRHRRPTQTSRTPDSRRRRSRRRRARKRRLCAPAAEQKASKTLGSFLGEQSPKSRRGSSIHWWPVVHEPWHPGTQKGDDDRAQKQMLRDLELLEEGHASGGGAWTFVHEEVRLEPRPEVACDKSDRWQLEIRGLSARTVAPTELAMLDQDQDLEGQGAKVPTRRLWRVVPCRSRPWR